jgi:hypothetical protein
MNLGCKGHAIPKRIDNFRSLGKLIDLKIAKLSALEPIPSGKNDTNGTMIQNLLDVLRQPLSNGRKKVKIDLNKNPP